jgi:hypothetical protein
MGFVFFGSVGRRGNALHVKRMKSPRLHRVRNNSESSLDAPLLQSC